MSVGEVEARIDNAAGKRYDDGQVDDIGKTTVW